MTKRRYCSQLMEVSQLILLINLSQRACVEDCYVGLS